jgi:hypothetical membrane protein
VNSSLVDAQAGARGHHSCGKQRVL